MTKLIGVCSKGKKNDLNPSCKYKRKRCTRMHPKKVNLVLREDASIEGAMSLMEKTLVGKKVVEGSMRRWLEMN